MNTKIIVSIFVLLSVILLGSFMNYEEFVATDINYNKLYKKNKDLDYVSNYFDFNINPIKNIRTQQIAPIMGKQNDMKSKSLWGSAKVSKNYNKISNRIPDKYSTKHEYKHKIF